ncbi:hypothetical protein P167DRAFT_546971 [Morchella conica CCBAS932]|uniref:Uncharacterized protein n=1 Tax=Morchella conica CCBAS932 TaxID=1392247 RepID=A0A3N4KMR2_9PEZI|nr:hypothetical protein P167DRAFT_546971 [Morchella conica CCBAS932]
MEYDSITVRPPACNWAQGACFCSSTDNNADNTGVPAPKSSPTRSRSREEEESKDATYHPPRKRVRGTYRDASSCTPPNETQECRPLWASARINRNTAIDDLRVGDQALENMRTNSTPRAATPILWLAERRKPMPSSTPTNLAATDENVEARAVKEERLSIERELSMETLQGMLPSPSTTPKNSVKVQEEPVRKKRENYAEMTESMPPAPPSTRGTPRGEPEVKKEDIGIKRAGGAHSPGARAAEAELLVDGRHTAEEISVAEAILMLAVALQACGGEQYRGEQISKTKSMKD